MSDPTVDIKELFQRYQQWAQITGTKYAQKQWLLSKWENFEGVDWSSEKIDCLLQTITASLNLSATHRWGDLGCGGGWLTAALAQRSSDGLGVDFSPGMLEKAKTFFSKIPYACAEISQLPFRNETFDRLLCYFVFVNFADDEFAQKCFLEIFRVLKKGGQAVIGQLPDKNGSALYDAAKKEYLEYCQKNFQMGSSTRGSCYMPQKLYDRNALKFFFEKQGLNYKFVDSFNPFYRPGAPQVVPWRFDVVLQKQ